MTDFDKIKEGIVLDPDCRANKCRSCVGDPCQHFCHTEDGEGAGDGQGT